VASHHGQQIRPLGFYGHEEEIPYNFFSNFWEGSPFSFHLPPY